jgi:hypothetical protein
MDWIMGLTSHCLRRSELLTAAKLKLMDSAEFPAWTQGEEEVLKIAIAYAIYNGKLPL